MNHQHHLHHESVPSGLVIIYVPDLTSLAKRSSARASILVQKLPDSLYGLLIALAMDIVATASNMCDPALP